MRSRKNKYPENQYLSEAQALRAGGQDRVILPILQHSKVEAFTGF
jgi:hypothetical protein